MRRSKNHLIGLLLISMAAFAAPGDTTWITVFQNLRPESHGNYDTTVLFPAAKRYRKIRMHYELGRYACSGNPQYCGSWDYTTQLFALPKGNSPIEIGRVITPYATDWLQKGRSHNYILDATDYTSLLHDSVQLRFRYDGYSWGFSFNIRFELIEGTPPMDAIAVENIYDGYFAFGNTANPIENHLVATALTYTTPRSAVRNVITGHGADNTGCSEFCNKYYELKINNLQVAKKQLWRSDCGWNEVYPQTGTWIFDRANWCPGAVVWPIYHFLDGVTTPSGTFTANIDMEPYTNANPSGGYLFASQLIHYSDMNFFTDASIDDIVAPSHDPNYARQNPACANPVIRLKNTGAGQLYTVTFEYGLTGRTLSTYTWTGQLSSLQTTDVVFPANLPVMAHSVAAQFEARIINVNGMPDGNPENDVYYSKTKPVIIAPKDFVVQLGTNKSVSGSVSETSWKLFNDSGNIVAQRVNAAPGVIHLDTVKNLPPGCYRLEVNDAGCDGFDWWYYQHYPVNPGKGNMRIDKLGQNNTIFLFTGDFGCGFSQHFLVGSYPPPPPVQNTTGLDGFFSNNHINIYPNPAEGAAILAINLQQPSVVSYQVTDIGGRLITRGETGKVGLHLETIPANGLKPGVYFVTVAVDDMYTTTRKLIIR